VILICVIWRTVTNILQECAASTFRVYPSNKNTCTRKYGYYVGKSNLGGKAMGGVSKWSGWDRYLRGNDRWPDVRSGNLAMDFRI
jgi:hypothetical protein